MKIDDHEIPKSVLQAWCAALARLPDSKVRGLASELGLGAGFRANKMPPEVARTRLRSALETCSELPKKVRLALREVSPASALMVPMSDEFLIEQSERLVRCLGAAETTAALLLDGRASLREHAIGRLAAWDGSESVEEDRHLAGEELANELQSLFRALQSLQPPGQIACPTGADKPDSAPLTDRAPRPQSERQLVIALRERRREAGRLAHELAASRQEVERGRAELDRLRPALERERQRAELAESELSELREQFEAQVLERVQALLDDRLLPWLVPAQQLAQAAEDPLGQSLLDQAEQLLQDQAAIDRRYGLRSHLKEELEACQRMLGRLSEARAESLRPLPELAKFQHEIRQRIGTLQQQLGDPLVQDPGTSSNLARLQEAMAQADSLEKLSAIRQALRAAEPLDLLAEDERTQAYALLADLATRFYARQGICRSTTQDREGLRNLPLYALQSTLALGHRATLLVDGHNVLFTLAALFRPYFDDGIPGSQARQALEQRLAVLARRHPRLNLQLWFDAGSASERTVSDNFRVSFSGGSGSNRADRQIVAFLHHLEAASPGLARAVVTADRDEARAAERTGGMVLAPEELAIWLGEIRSA